MPSEFLLVAEQVIRLLKQPLSAKDIVSYALEHGLFSHNVSGQTPHQTLKSKLSVEIRKLGDASRFVRTEPGRFFLRALLDGDARIYHAPPLQKSMKRESVAAIPTSVFSSIVRFQGLRKSWRSVQRRLIASGSCTLIDRMVAEATEEYKQVLTYVVVTRNGQVLCYKRGSFNRVESYLRGALCVGFGGHVTDVDSLPLFPAADMGVNNCVVRELNEELDLPNEDKRRLVAGHGLECIGVLNDDSTSVGRRHFALIYRYEVSTDGRWKNPKRGEKSVTQLRWLGKQAVVPPIWDFEYWSQLVLRAFFGNLVTTRQSYKILRRRPLTPPHILCLVGEVGSGKSITTSILKQEFGYETLNTGRVLADLLGIPPVPLTPRVEFQKRAWSFITSEDGPGRLASAIAASVSGSREPRILIDGLRQRATFERLKEAVVTRSVGMLYIYAPADLAYGFYSSRETNAGSFLDYLSVRNADVEREIPGMIGIADGVIYNWTGERFHQQTIKAMFRDLGIPRV